MPTVFCRVSSEKEYVEDHQTGCLNTNKSDDTQSAKLAERNGGLVCLTNIETVHGVGPQPQNSTTFTLSVRFGVFLQEHIDNMRQCKIPIKDTRAPA